MLKGLWSVELISNGNNFSAGDVVFENGRILGGNAPVTFLGTYQVNSDAIVLDATVTIFPSESISVFGNRRQFKLNLEGQPSHATFEVHGFMIEDSAIKISVRFTRRYDIKPNP